MCGIVGAVMKSDVVPDIVEGLEKLSYRGYDSAGVASLNNGSIARRRAAGKIDCLKSVINNDPLNGSAAVGHTRWATHGAPTENNAHPHVAGAVAVVHNGIIENHEKLRRELRERGCVFSSDTDTETIPQLIRAELEAGHDVLTAARRALSRLEGQHAVCALMEGAGCDVDRRKERQSAGDWMRGGRVLCGFRRARISRQGPGSSIPGR